MTLEQTGTGATGTTATTTTNGPPAPADKVFTQAEVDAIVLKRAERVAADKYNDYASLQAKAKQLDDIEAASATELEKAVKKARDEERVAVTAEVTRDRILDKIEVAAAGKFADVEDARLRVGRRSADFIGKDGAIDMAAIKTAVDKELESAPHLRAASGTPKLQPDHSQGSAEKGATDRASLGTAEAARRFGKPAGQQ